MKKATQFLFVCFVISGLIGHVSANPAVGWEPKGQVECIAPSNPGGGWDAICRSSSNVLYRTGQIKTPVSVTNMAGGSGSLALAHVVNRRKSDSNLLVAASSTLTLTMAAQLTPYTYQNLTPLAQIATEYAGIFVRSDSEYKSFADFANALKTNPGRITFAGGSAIGSGDHIRLCLLVKAMGVDPGKVTYVPFQGGGEALVSVLGGHTNVMSSSLSEMVGQLEAKKVRALVLLSNKRSTKLKDIPTTAEFGVMANYPLWRGLLMAPAISAEALTFWSNSIRGMVASSEWNKELEKLGWEPSLMLGQEFARHVDSELKESRGLLKEIGILK